MAKTEEEKKAWAEKMKAAREAKKKEAEEAARTEQKPDTPTNTGGETPPSGTESETTKETPPDEKPSGNTENTQTFTKEQLEETVDAAVARAMEGANAIIAVLQQQIETRSPQIVQMMGETEKVVFRFQSECADDNTAIFGPGGVYGQITGKTGYVRVPKSELGRFMDESVRWLIDNRKLIYLSGFSDEEREQYGVDYREGEVLDEKAFNKLLDIGRDLLAIFPKLCVSHREMVARRYIDAYANGDTRANDRELMVALNSMSQKDYLNTPKGDPRRRGAFYPVIEAMNARDAALL